MFHMQQWTRLVEQLISLPEHHGVDINGFPELSENDFWFMEENDTTLIE